MFSVSSMQFSESWQLLMDWMTEVEQTLDTHKEIAVSHEEIKQQLTEQKVTLSQKQYCINLNITSVMFKWDCSFNNTTKYMKYFIDLLDQTC